METEERIIRLSKDGRWHPAKPIPYSPSIPERLKAMLAHLRGERTWWEKYNDKVGGGNLMTPTEELRKGLDEREIEWWCAQGITFWNCKDGRECAAYEYRSGDEVHLAMKVLALTPAQAIAATVGVKVSRDLRQALDFMRIWIEEDAHLGESEISRELERAEGLRKLDAIEQAIAATVDAPTLPPMPPRPTSKDVYRYRDEHGGDVPLAECLQILKREWREACDQIYSSFPIADANRIVRAHDGVGSCKCSACGWNIEPHDLFCRRCGARLTATTYDFG